MRYCKDAVTYLQTSISDDEARIFEHFLVETKGVNGHNLFEDFVCHCKNGMADLQKPVQVVVTKVQDLNEILSKQKTSKGLFENSSRGCKNGVATLKKNPFRMVRPRSTR